MKKANDLKRQSYEPSVNNIDIEVYRLIVSRSSTRSIFIFAVSVVVTIIIYQTIAMWSRPDSTAVRLIIPDGNLLQRLVPLLIVFSMFWCVFFSIARYFWIKREWKMSADPTISAAVKISRRGSIEQVAQTLGDINHINRGISYYRLLGLVIQLRRSTNNHNYQFVKDLWSLENDRIASDYTFARVLIWAMPLMGFVGTVVGISLSVGEFSSFLQFSGSNIEIAVIKERLAAVASGLSFAFDTTLLGLLGSLIAMWLTSVVQNSEERFLTSVDARSLEVLGRFS